HVAASQLRTRAAQLGFDARMLLDGDATRAAVLNAIDAAAAAIGDRGTFLLSYAGHGRLVSGPHDNLWILSDAAVPDSEFAAKWSRFPTGVRVILIFDACNSETMGFLDRMAMTARAMGHAVVRAARRARAALSRSAAAPDPGDT